MPPRGVIRNRELRQQILDFSNLRYGNITATDIDGFNDGVIEYKGRGYLFIEIKYEERELPYGQRLAFTRLSDDLESSGNPTLFVISSHQIHDPAVDVDVAETEVREFRYGGKWYSLSRPLTTKQISDSFIRSLEKRIPWRIPERARLGFCSEFKPSLTPSGVNVN